MPPIDPPTAIAALVIAAVWAVAVIVLGKLTPPNNRRNQNGRY